MFGRLIEFGKIGMKPNVNEAVKCYKKVYEKNDMTGCALLGVAIFNGIGELENDENEGSRLIKISAESNNLYGISFNAVLLINDKKLQFESYKKTAECGFSIGYYLVANSYNNGEGVEKDLKMAAKYYKRGFEEGHLSSSLYYGMIYYIDQPEFGIKANHKRLNKYLKFAADHGSTDAMRFYGNFLSETGKSPEKIKKYFKMGIEMGDPNCMVTYACHLIDGNGVPQNYEKAAKYLKMGADLGHKDCINIYAKLLEEGKGVEKNEEEARRYRLLIQQNDNCLIQ